MKIADLYIRVSTDEQADKGYSQRSQEELLRKYCSINNFSVRYVIFEDHSAKTFDRPEWKKYLSVLKRNKNQADLVLFLKWDRFSRNAGDAYQMINLLRKMGIEPQAIEQPLDLTIPENKMMLAFYLAAPEVENDRRALNVIHGMRRAKKEGRFMGKAPIGYLNKTDESGRKYITPDLQQSEIIKWAFKKIAEGVFNTEQIYRMAKKKGFTSTKSPFWMAMRNPIYSGKIFIPKYKDEESHFINGSHEAIISNELYYKAQDMLDGRKRNYKPKIVSNEFFPLRGFLICPKCTRLLTGSSSRGRTKYYSYYHCTDGCNCRYRVDSVNEAIALEIKRYIPNQEVISVFKILLQESWDEQNGHQQDEGKQLLSQIKEVEEKVKYLQELLSSREIEPADFREMKSEHNNRLEKLKAKLDASSNETLEIKGLLDKGISNLLKLENIFETADAEKKKEVIGSMYPEKLTFDGFGVRTTRINEVIQLIYSVGEGFSENKKGQIGEKSALSLKVGLQGFEP